MQIFVGHQAQHRDRSGDFTIRSNSYVQNDEVGANRQAQETMQALRKKEHLTKEEEKLMYQMKHIIILELALKYPTHEFRIEKKGDVIGA